MRQALFLMMLLASILAIAQTAATNKLTDEQQLLKDQSDLIAAENMNDASAFQRIVADDWVNAGPQGQQHLSK
jgi:hypothetical protein